MTLDAPKKRCRIPPLFQAQEIVWFLIESPDNLQIDPFSDPGYVSSSLRSQSSEHGGGVGGVMARVLPRKKKTTVADPQDAWGILKDMRGQDDRQMYR